jgi:hypothetical protein
MPSGPRRIRRGPQVFGLSLATSADLVRSWFAPPITGDEMSPRPLSRQDNRHGKSRSQALGLLAPHLAPEQPGEALAAAKTIGDGKYRAQALGSFAAQLPREQIADCRQGA